MPHTNTHKQGSRGAGTLLILTLQSSHGDGVALRVWLWGVGVTHGVRGRPMPASSLRRTTFLGASCPRLEPLSLPRGIIWGCRHGALLRGAHRIPQPLCTMPVTFAHPPKPHLRAALSTSPRITLTVGGGTSARRVSVGHRGDGPVPPGCSPPPPPHSLSAPHPRLRSGGGCGRVSPPRLSIVPIRRSSGGAPSPQAGNRWLEAAC